MRVTLHPTPRENFEEGDEEREEAKEEKPRWPLNKTTALFIVIQWILVVLFVKFVKYSKRADHAYWRNNFHPFLGGYYQKDVLPSEDVQSLQDINVLVLLGMALRYACFKEYRYSAVAFSLLLWAAGLQWAILCRGFVTMRVQNATYIEIDASRILTAELSGLSVAVSHGAMLGLATPMQLIVLLFLHIPLQVVNEYICRSALKAVDRGQGMTVHVFGAIFGLCAASVISPELKRVKTPIGKSRIFSTFGILFVIAKWSSIAGSVTEGHSRHRVVVNTLLAVSAACLTAFPVSSLCDKGRRYSYEDIETGLLSGAVAVSTVSDLGTTTFGALILGIVASATCIAVRRKIKPLLFKSYLFVDVADVAINHGLAGIIGGLTSSIIALAPTSHGEHKETLYLMFPARAPLSGTSDLLEINKYLNVPAGLNRTAAGQSAFQLLAILITLLMSAVGGGITGLLLRLRCFSHLRQAQVFNDCKFWRQ